MLLQTGFSFTNSIDFLIETGVYDILLPFLLIFAIVFAILEKTKILGENKTNIDVIVSLVIGLLLIVQRPIVDTILLFLPRVSLMIVVILMGLLVISMVAGKSFEGLKGTVFGVAVVVIIIAIILALTTPDTGLGGVYLSQYDRNALLSIGVPLLILFLVIAMVTAKPKNANDKGTATKFLEALQKGFGGND